MNQLAYLDPASGSMIVATAAAGLAGIGVAAKTMWSSKTSRFRKAGTGGAAGETVETPEAEYAADED